MPGVPRELIVHELHLDPKAKPVKQRLRHFTQDKKDVLKREVATLLHTDFIKCTTRIGSPIPFLYPKGIKIGGCVFIILIDQVVDSTTGCSLLSFLDCYSGYHQIPLKVDDQIKTSFITSFGAFCYTTMPFGLKSEGATY
jgi:hypothetical protein